MKPSPKIRIDDTVYIALLDNIKNGVWKSGEKLPSEHALCDMLNVSRVSVRSALQRLQALGYIEVKRAKGSYVAGYTAFDFSKFAETITMPEKEFNDMAVLREVIETAAIQLIIANPGKVALTSLKEELDSMKKAANLLDLDAYTRHDVKFHLSLIAASGNEKFSQFTLIFKDDLYLYLREMNKFIVRDKRDPELLHTRFTVNYRFHHNLYDALKKKDPLALELQERQLVRARESRNYYFQRVRGKSKARS